MVAQRHRNSTDGSADDLVEDAHTSSYGCVHADVGATDPAIDPALRDGAAARACDAQGEEGSASVSPGRLEAFSGRVTVITITLLNLEIKLPDGGGSLLYSLDSLRPSYLGFVLSFLLVGQVWLNHHAIFVWMCSIDRRMLICNLFLPLDVAFLPFATPVLTRLLKSGHDERTGAVFHGMAMAIGGLFSNALWRVSIRDRGRLRVEASEAEVRSMIRRFAMGPWLYPPAVLLGMVSA